jgi:MoaA/NifB/PqqE/SkfB family radical SAM enzyme
MPAAGKRHLVKGMLAQYPFVLKNFRAYFGNLWRRNVLRTTIVTPYSAIFYATHKCNLDCSYCTQKNPEVFSQELDTESTIEIFRNIRKDVDTLLITGGECLMRPDIEELVRAAKQDCRFRSVLVVTNGVLLHKKLSILEHLNGLIVSLDALEHDPSDAMSKSAQAPRVIDNLMLAKQRMRPSAITLSCVLDIWNLSQAERILDFAAEHDFQFSVQSSQNNGKHPNFAFLKDQRYQAFVDRLIERRRQGAARINGTPKLLETLLRFEEFNCYPTMFPRVYPNGDVFYPCEVLRKIAGNLLQDGSISAAFKRGRELYGETPKCRNNCFLFGNVLSSYYVEDFWGFAGDTVRAGHRS